MKRILVVSIVVSSITGCSFLIDSSQYVGTGDGGGGQHDAGVRDGGAGDGGARDAGALDGGLPPDVVIGTSILRFVSATDETPVPEDLSTYEIQALIPDPAEPSGFRVQDGQGFANGTFRIEGVPPGTFYLRLLNTGQSSVTYYVTDEHVLDLGDFRGGRTDAVDVVGRQQLELHLTSMQPWAAGDEIILEEFNTASEEWDIQDILMPPPTRGMTELQATHDWGCTSGYCYAHRPSNRPALIDSSKGDRLYVNHVGASVARDDFGRLQTVRRVVDLAVFDGITMTPGETTTLDLAFTANTPTITLDFTFDRASFDANYTDGRSRFSEAFSAIWVGPSVDREILISPPVAQASYDDWSGPAPRRSTVTIQYGDPYPSEWPRWLYQGYNRRRWYRLPGTTNPGAFQFGTARSQALPSLIPARPVFAPPTDILVAGADATEGGRLAFDRRTPVAIEWAPVGAARYYEVRVYKVYADGPRNRFEGVSILRTESTSLTLPVDAFGAAEYVFFSVEAVQDHGEYARGVLRRHFPPVEAGVTTGMFRLSATCGDGDVDPGEDCDPGDTATADCDIDCTTPVCGDGLHNALAGEQCDTVVATSSCDDDCTLPVCGDGYRNPSTEDCDDGNTMNDGNGCSATCVSNASCGDGAVQSAIEACDDGNNTDDGNGCDARCQAVNNCGDGVVEGATGPDGQPLEQCDSGGVDTTSCNGGWCSTPACGDGYFNSAAEVCDTGGDSPTCDWDCTPVICGDGHVNASVEPCDDGNANDGDGCDHACQIEAGYVCSGEPSSCSPA